MKNYGTQKNSHLLISAGIVIPVAFGYGLFPKEVLPLVFDFKVETVDLNNVFRATMGLYLSFGLLWILGITKPQYWEAATIAQILFMGGLAFGIILSLLLDGFPSLVFSIGVLGEFVLAVWGIIQLLKAKKLKKSLK